ncbi:hypothetical protein [Comamonas sp.]|uniref:hypothetical protein n=1 Tax=Comamonas sp. TaxID=34028 RepID=UPI0028A1F7BA|nr:hypothetical protein [Comamonas sp.]
MKLKIIPSLFIFIGSYLPLSIILLIQDIDDHSWSSSFCWKNLSNCVAPSFKNPWLSLPFFAVCTISCILLIKYFLKKNYATDEVYVQSSKPIPNDLINYVFPYIVSFMGMDFSDTKKFFGFIIFFLWLFLITYKSGQILMNPIILLSEWKLYEATVKTKEGSRHVRMLSSQKIADNHHYKSCIVHGVYILVKSNGDENNE